MIRWCVVCLIAAVISGCSKSSTDTKPDSKLLDQKGSSSGSSGPEATTQEMISTMNQLAIALESVQDAVAANAAIPRIKSTGNKIAELKEKMKAYKLSHEEDQKLGEKHETELSATYYRVKDATIKAVQKAPGQAHQLARTLAEMGQLHAGLDLFEVEEHTYPDGARANLLMTVQRTLIGESLTHPVQLRRLATTYYHRRGPVGVVLEKLNWFPGPPNTYWADARLPASLVMLTAGDVLNANPLPLSPLVGAWSEPPIAVVGLGAGTLGQKYRGGA